MTRSDKLKNLLQISDLATVREDERKPLSRTNLHVNRIFRVKAADAKKFAATTN